MNRPAPPIRVLLSTAAALALLLAVQRPARADDEIDLSSDGKSDEATFLVYAYQNLRDSAAYAPAGQQRRHFRALRAQASAYAEHAKERKVDAKVRALFDDLAAALEAVEDFLTALD